MQIDLLYFPGCPNVAQTRANLNAALARVGRVAQWREWNLAGDETPAALRRFGSPTLLINGQDIEAVGRGAPSPEASACRIYTGEGFTSGAPSVGAISAALEREVASEQRPWRRFFANVPATGAALLPAAKCPACLAAYTGILSSLGITNVLLTEILLPLTIVLILISLLALGYRANRRRGYGPLLLGVGASAALLIGKFWLDWPAVWYGGVALLVIASLWNAWPRKMPMAPTAPACPACTSTRRT